MADVIRELVVRLAYEVDDSGLDQFDRGTEQAKKGTEELGEGIDEAGVKTVALGNILANGATALANLAAQAVQAAAAFAVDLVTGFVETGDEIAKTSKQLDVNAQSLQRLRFAAERSGVSQSNLDKALRTLQVGLVDAREKGVGPAVEALELLGLTVDDIPTDDAEEALGIIGEALGDLEDPAERSAAAAKLLGARAGVELKTLLNEGRDGIKALGDEAEALGGVLEDDALTSAENLADGFTNINTAAEGAKNQLGAALAPAMIEVTDLITEQILENDQLIQQDLPALFEALAEVIPPLVEFTVDLVESIAFLVREYKRFNEENETGIGQLGVLRSVFEALVSPIRVVSDLIERAAKALDDLADRVDVIGNARDRINAAFGIDDTPVIRTRVSAADIAKSVQTGESQEEIARKRIDAEQQAREIEAQDLAAESARNEQFDRQQRRLERDQQKAEAASEGGGSKGGRKGRGRGRGGGGGRSRGAAAAQASGAANDPLAGFDQSVLDVLGAPDDPVAAVLAAGESSTPSRAGGGADPLGGAQITRIDASYNAPTNVTITLSAEALERIEQGGGLRPAADELEGIIETRNRRAFEFFQQGVKV